MREEICLTLIVTKFFKDLLIFRPWMCKCPDKESAERRKVIVCGGFVFREFHSGNLDTCVHPVLRPLGTVVESLGLSDFVVVVRKLQIDPAAVNRELRAKDLTTKD